MTLAGITVACPCGEVYELKPEYAGRLLECPVCGHHLRAGRGPSAPRAPAAAGDPPAERRGLLFGPRKG